MRLVAISGGTGSAKLVRGLAAVVPQMTVVANPGDNLWMHGLYVCPDIDIVTYTLAGIADRSKGWGIDHDSFYTLGQLEAMGEPAWFRLGDRDLAISIVRTELLRRGHSLTSVTSEVCNRLGVVQKVLPATDEPLETHILTDEGEMHLQDFWVKNAGRPKVMGIRYEGAPRARPSTQVVEALKRAEVVVICPGNPVTSIGPILSLRGMKKLLTGIDSTVLAVSPMVGTAPVSGPAGVFLKAVGARPDSVGVAGLYKGLVDRFFIHPADSSMKGEIERMGMTAVATDTIMGDESSEVRLARELASI
ncbi:MAG TPA: 2-phospho-L-lactate transferase [Nitrososphaerales archaeon]|nr:2-phospho-L-lactate transferase [Nitrososphaerales archaeon]